MGCFRSATRNHDFKFLATAKTHSRIDLSPIIVSCHASRNAPQFGIGFFANVGTLEFDIHSPARKVAGKTLPGAT
jgi:hypothetical protein